IETVSQNGTYYVNLTPADLGCSAPAGTLYEYNCTIGFTAYDNATNNASSAMVIIVDDYAPRVTVTYTNETIVNSLSESINFTVTVTEGYLANITFRNATNLSGDGVTIVASNFTAQGAGNYTSNSTPTAMGITDGIYNITIGAWDKLGNVNFSSVTTITVDTTVPTSEIISPTNDSEVTSTTITMNGSDAIDSALSYVIYFNGTISSNVAPNKVTTSGYDWNLQEVTEGNDYNLTLELTDDAGNKKNSTG
ncbi:unnamed protein product, partial [marine sediment metagenome]